MTPNHKCTQEWKIKTLEINQVNFMEILKEVKDDVKDIKRYLFEWWLEQNYAKKESVQRLWIIVWSVVWFVFTALWTAIMVLLFNK
jgi:hypothetical protein